ncbi:MAG: transposase [Candidatus Paceibacteria bacterium]
MELYHLLNRGTDKRNLVMDNLDRRRFVRNLYEMNDKRPVDHIDRIPDIRRRVNTKRRQEREPFVQIHAWCLMNNHYHLLVSEIAEGGVSKFLKKLNMGYSKYFNARHERSGTLFQGKTKKILVEREAHFMWILHYIHFNPLDYFKQAGNWRNQCLTKPERAIEWLKQYHWSSFRDYAGEETFPEIVTGSFMFENRAKHVREAYRYLSSLGSATPLPLSDFE